MNIIEKLEKYFYENDKNLIAVYIISEVLLIDNTYVFNTWQLYKDGDGIRESKDHYEIKKFQIDNFFKYNIGKINKGVNNE